MFENISLEGLIIMGQVVIVTLAILNVFTAVILYKYRPHLIISGVSISPKRKPGRPKKK